MRVAMLLSGGVDSAVAMRLAQQAGHEITAFYLKIWLEDELAYLGNCPWQEDLAYVEAVCAQAGVPLEVVNLQRAYFDHVVSYAIEEVRCGRTPNPDIFCNRLIKFGLFTAYIDSTYPGKFDHIASGHYAQLQEKDGHHLLACSPDTIKDQTYFLSYLTQDQLRRSLFPIGHLTKPEVRALAYQFDLPNKDRKDSQGICFLGKLKFNDFLAHYLGTRKGDQIEYETGKKLGEHNGFWFHTIGQRQGSRLGGGPWYVVAKDPAANKVYLSRDYYASDKKRNQLWVKDLNWFSGHAPEDDGLTVKLRHGPHKAPCRITREGELMRIDLDHDDQGIAPGQLVAFYQGECCLGAGIIAR